MKPSPMAVAVEKVTGMASAVITVGTQSVGSSQATSRSARPARQGTAAAPGRFRRAAGMVRPGLPNA